jgi:hypothetical protein
VLKKRALLIAIVYAVALATLSLVQLNLGKLSRITPSFSDKIFHFFAYAMLAYLWFRVFNARKNEIQKIAIGCTLIFTVTFGVIIEFLQENFTYTRVFDSFDILANILGTIFAILIIMIQNRSDVKKY